MRMAARVLRRLSQQEAALHKTVSPVQDHAGKIYAGLIRADEESLFLFRQQGNGVNSRPVNPFLTEQMIMLCDGIIDNSGSCLDLIGVKFLSSRMDCACFVRVAVV